MALSDVLKGMRESSYGENPSNKEDGSERVLELSEEEVKSLGQMQPDAEVMVQVTGRLGDGCIYVKSVKGQGSGPDVSADAEEAMAKSRPVQMQTLPSPS